MLRIKCSGCLKTRLFHSSYKYFNISQSSTRQFKTSIISFNHYATLGIDKSASDKEIKKAFRSKSLKCHPDKFPGNKQKETEFKNLSEAYQVLSSKKERNEYDQKHANSPGSSFDSNKNPFARPEHETYNRFNKRYRADLNNRKYRTEANFERNEDWHRIHQELNRRRYEAWEGRQADFSDFMHGRKGTDFKDFRKWYNEPASDFDEGGKNKSWAEGYYEKKRHGSAERMERTFKENQFQRYHMHYQRRVQEEQLRRFLILMIGILIIHTMCLALREQDMGPYALQHSGNYYNGPNPAASSIHDVTVAEMVRRRVEKEREAKIQRDAEAASAYIEAKLNRDIAPRER